MEEQESSPQTTQRQHVDHHEDQDSPQEPARAKPEPAQKQHRRNRLILSILAMFVAGYIVAFSSQVQFFTPEIPRKVWVYSTKESTSEAMPSWLADNLHQFAGKLGFQVNKITMKNYENFVNESSKASLKKMTESFKLKFATRGSRSDIVYREGHFLLKQLIALKVLLENGGVLISEDLVLTQNITWIDRIHENPYVVRKEKGRTEVIGFFDPRFSSTKHKQPTDEPIYAPYKYLWRTPAMNCSFLASIKDSRFINKMVIEVNKTLQKLEIKLPQLRNTAIVQKYKWWMSQYEPLVSISKQIFEQRAKHLKQNQLAVDSYGVSLINVFYGPAKTLQQFEPKDPELIMHYLTNLPYEQLKTYLGPMPYAQFIPLKLKPQNIVNMVKSRKNVMEGSLFARIFPSTSSSKLYPNFEDGFTDPNATRWDALPKKVWMIWNQGFQAAPLLDRIGYAIAEKALRNKGYEVHLVQFKNCQKFLDKQTYMRIAKTVNDRTYPRHKTTASDLLRLALLLKHGGIYMDISTILRTDLDWVHQVTKLPSQYVFNRYGKVPRMLSFFYAFSGGPGRWVVDPMYNTKTFRHIGLENSFIAVEKGHELIRQWLDLTLQLLNTTYAEVVSTLDSCGVIENRYVSDGSTYAMPMESVSCVIGRREEQLAKQNNRNAVNAYHYYGYWQLNGHLGSQKYRFWNNLEGLNYDFNPYFTEYSEEYVNGLIGTPLTAYTKMVHYEAKQFSKILSDPAYKIHPESFLARVLRQNRLELKQIKGKMSVIR